MLALVMLSTVLGTVSPATSSQVHLLTQQLVLGSMPRELADDPLLPSRVGVDPDAGRVSGYEVLLGALSILGVDSVAATIVVFGVLAALSNSQATSALAAIAFLLLEGVVVPIVAALVVNGVSGPAPKGGGIGGALLGAFLAQIVAAGLLLLAASGVAWIIIPALVAHFILVPGGASLGLHWGQARSIAAPLAPMEPPATYVPSLRIQALGSGFSQTAPVLAFAF